MPGVGVYHCFARSGGTLVNRLLGATPGVVVLSEVAPAASVLDPVTQAVEWLDLAAADEADALRRLDFGALIGELARRADARDERLVVRDFLTPSFLDGAYDDVVPTSTLELPGVLEAAGVEVRSAVIARRAATVYASMRRSFPHLAALPLDTFAVAYHGYAVAVAELPIVRYEELTAAPAEHLERLCSLLDCPFDAASLERFAGFRECTGDLLLATPSRGDELDRVTVLPEPADDAAFVAASAHPLCRAADDIFGFEAIGDPTPAAGAVAAYAAVLAGTRRSLRDARQAGRHADAAASASHARAEAAEEHARIAAEEAQRVQRAWDRAVGELDRAEDIAADRLRQIALLLEEVDRLGQPPITLDPEGTTTP